MNLAVSMMIKRWIQGALRFQINILVGSTCANSGICGQLDSQQNWSWVFQAMATLLAGGTRAIDGGTMNYNAESFFGDLHRFVLWTLDHTSFLV